jgi:adenosylhomocysteine nucleosidase
MSALAPRLSATTAIVAAMSQELEALLAGVAHDHIEQHAGRRFHFSQLHGEPVVMVLCGIGKVAAAATTALLAERYGVQRIVFTGVAGGLHVDVRVGDVVVATELLQHDMDARPLFARHEVPLTGKSRFAADAALSAALADAARALLADLPAHLGPEAAGLIGTHTPRLHQGLIVSGDVFVGSAEASQALRRDLPDALAVEMEGAALAQVCHDLGLPFAVLRTVSDRADDTAHVDFLRFVQGVASRASAAVVQHWLGSAAQHR